MILHCVFCRSRPELSPSELALVESALSGLVGQIDGLRNCRFGGNVEAGGTYSEAGFGFVMEFEDEASLTRYLDHPAQRQARVALLAICDGGQSGVKVYDLDVPSA